MKWVQSGVMKSRLILPTLCVLLLLRRRLGLERLGTPVVRQGCNTRGHCSSVYQLCSLFGFWRVILRKGLPTKSIVEIRFLTLFRMVPIGSFYLGASSTTPLSSAFGRPQSMSQASLPFPPTSPPTNTSPKSSPASYRASMPAPARGNSTPGISSAFINQPSSAGRPPQSRFEPTLEEGSEDQGLQRVQLERARTVGSVTTTESKRKSSGGMNPQFKFPPSPPPTSSTSATAPAPGTPQVNSAGIQPDLQRSDSPPAVIVDQSSLNLKGKQRQVDEASMRPAVVTPSSIEVPAPPLVEKERTATRASLDDSADDDVGDTVDIPLN